MVRDAASAEHGSATFCCWSLARFEAPMLAAPDRRLACRTTARTPNAGTTSSSPAAKPPELRAETVQMGYSLRALLRAARATPRRSQRSSAPSFPAAFALAAARAGTSIAHDALAAYLWAWLENQVMAAMKAVPLGQTDGQRMLLALGARLERGRGARPPRSTTTRWAPTRPAWRCLSAPSRNPVHAGCSDHERSISQPLRVGIGGPVGSGKTALTLALCKALRDRYQIAVVTNDIYTEEDAQFLVRNDALAPERILGVETGGCPHTAIREDASINLEAVGAPARAAFPIWSWSSSSPAATISPRPSAPSCPT